MSRKTSSVDITGSSVDSPIGAAVQRWEGDARIGDRMPPFAAHRYSVDTALLSSQLIDRSATQAEGIGYVKQAFRVADEQ